MLDLKADLLDCGADIVMKVGLLSLAAPHTLRGSAEDLFCGAGIAVKEVEIFHHHHVADGPDGETQRAGPSSGRVLRLG